MQILALPRFKSNSWRTPKNSFLGDLPDMTGTSGTTVPLILPWKRCKYHIYDWSLAFFFPAQNLEMQRPCPLGHVAFTLLFWQHWGAGLRKMVEHSKEGLLHASHAPELSCRYPLLAIAWGETLGQVNFWSRAVLASLTLHSFTVAL